MAFLFKNYDCAFLFAYGYDKEETVKRMKDFCSSSNISVYGCAFGPGTCNREDVKQDFAAVIQAMKENGMPCFLIVKSVDSLLIGFKEMEEISQMVERGEIVVWCLDEHAMLANPARASL